MRSWSLIQQHPASCHAIDVESLAIESRGVVKRLFEIRRLEKRILGKQGGMVGISRKQFEHAAHGDPHRPDARLPATLPTLNRNSIKQRRHRLCSTILKPRVFSRVEVRRLRIPMTGRMAFSWRICTY
jgi:hypothetical protein